nr:PREDICTED: myosin-11-like [Bemisia tabaci]XP_018902824.1 PREDICTED: myosin-11-like [Bemisia tabaci]
MGAVTWSSPAQAEPGPELDPSTDPKVCNDSGIEELNKGDANELKTDQKDTKEQHPISSHLHERENSEEADLEREYDIVKFSPEPEIQQNLEPIINHPTGGRIPEKIDKTEATRKVEDVSNGDTSNTQKTRILSLYDSFISNPSDGANAIFTTALTSTVDKTKSETITNKCEIRNNKEQETFVEGFHSDGESSQLRVRATEPNGIQPMTKENNCDVTLKSVNDSDQATPEESNSTHEFKFDELMSKILTEVEVGLETEEKVDKQLKIRAVEPSDIQPETEENNCDATLKSANDSDQVIPEESNFTQGFKFDELVSKILTEDDVELEVGGELNNVTEEEPERVEGEEVQSEGSNGDEEEDEETKERRERKRKEMEEFKLALAAKRSERQKAIASIVEEMRTLRKTSEELESEREEKKRLEAHVTALKDVAAISRQMLKIREIQVTDLKSKLESLETTSLNDFNELRVEYEKQMENIRSLRQLYDERAAAMSLEHQRQMERERAKVEVLELKLRDQETAFREHNDEVAELRKAVERAEAEREKVTGDYNELKERTSSLSCENKALSSQMTLINNLFSHMLTEPDLDLDKLTSLLKDNHNLINDLTIKGDINETAALLVHITRQAEANDESRVETTKERDSVQQEIAENLPKVWRVLLELLSHYSAPIAVPEADKTNGCYKDIETPYGTRSVISVSQTFLRLKDLILEKNSLVKEVGRLKTLNTTLETRLDNQEKRLSVVSSELHKTWGVVSKLRMQHKQLHTSEQILRYELQHKRLMLNELKEELEYCRVKWEEARKKNDQSEEDWLELRKEFSERKIRQTSNSAESGYDEDDSGQIGSSDSPSEDADEIDLPEDDCPSSTSVSPEPSFIGNTGEKGELSKATALAKDEHSQTMTISSMQSPDRICAEIPKDGEPVGSHQSPGLRTTSPEDSSIGDEVVINGSESPESQTMKEEKQAVMCESPEPTISVGDNISLHDVNQIEAEKKEKETETSTDNVTPERTSACSEDVPNVAEEKHVLENTGEKRFGNSNVSSSIEVDLLTQEDMRNLKHEVVAQREVNDGLILSESEPRHVTDPTNLHSSEDNDLQHNESEVTSQPESCVPNETFGSCALQNSEKEMEGNEGKQCKEAAENSDGLLDTRALRLKRLEEQCTSVLSKMSKTSQRSDSMSSRLEELHKKHGSSEVVDCTNTSEARTSPSAEDSQTNSNFSGNESSMTCDEILDARALRLTRLEEQCSSLLHKMVKTSERGDSISDKLDQLHEQYGSTDAEASEYGLEPKSEPETKQEAKQDKAPEKVEECESSEAVLDAKAFRLKRLEEQCSSLLTKMSRTTQGGDSISDQRDQLHEQYGPTDAEASECGLESKIESDTNQGASLVPEADEALNTAEECQSGETVLDARALRLKRLEEQCSSLLSKMSRTSQRGDSISDKLDQLHEQYGSTDAESSECRLEPKSESKVNQEPIIPTLTNPETGMVPKLDEEQNKEEECKGSEAVLDARALRLKRLEEQCSSLLTKMSRTSQRGDSISEKLEELHSQYGSTETVASSSDRERVGSRPRLQRMRRQSTSSSEGSTEVKDIDKTQEVQSSSDPPPTNGGSSAPMQDSTGTIEASERLGYDSENNLTLHNETSAFETESKGSERDVESKCSSITATSLDAPDDSKEIPGDLIAGINEEVEESSLYLKEQLSPGDLSDSISAVDSTDLLVENNEPTPSQRKETTQEYTSRSDEVFKSDMESQNETFKNTSDRLENRSLRLTMLENQSQNLFKRLTITSNKREALSNRLESLHEHYGSTENITSLEMVSTSGGNEDRVKADDPVETNSSESSLADLKRTGEEPSDPSVEIPSNNNAGFSTPPHEVSSTSLSPEKGQNLNGK